MFRTIKQAKLADSTFVLEDLVRQTFSRNEVERMLDKREKDSYEKGHNKGRADGLKEGEVKSYENARAEVEGKLALVEDLLRELNQTRDKILTESQEDIVTLAMVIASKIVHAEVKQSDVIETNVREAIKMAADRHSIRIRLNPADVAAIDACRKTFFDSIKNLDRIDIVDDDEIIPGGCVVEAGEGSIDARLDSQMEEIRKILLGG